MTTRYEYPVDGGYADTVAVLDDGRRLWINTQYSEVLARHADGCPKGHCAESCSNVCDEGARRRKATCTCGALDGVDEAAVLADARVYGRCGREPKPVESAEAKAKREAGLAALAKHGPGWCNMCHSYCYGDCEANL